MQTSVQAGRDHGWWPYLLPYLAFLLLVEVERRLPASVAPWMLLPKVCVPGLLFLYFRFARAAYSELRGARHWARALPLDVAVGVAGGLLWMAPYVALLAWQPGFWETLPEWLRPSPDGAFAPDQLGASRAWLALALRATGYGLVTPFVEELFVRSLAMRYADVFETGGDFRRVPIARFGWRSFWVVVVLFTISHVGWEFPVALGWIVATQLWFYQRRHLAPLVVVHAASNLTIFACVVALSGQLLDANGQPIDLWFFL